MGTHGIGRIAGVIVTTSVLLGLGASSAVPTTAQGGTNEAFPRVGVPAGAPPDWVRPGTRLTWYGETASIRTSPYTYVEDPEGDWEDPDTGKRYRQTETDEMPTAAAHGWTHTDVLAVDGDRVALETTLWPIDLTSDRLSVVPLGGGVFPGVAVDGAWVRADLLAGVESGRTGDLQVLRGAYQLGEAMVDSVAFLSRAEGSYASTVFDASTGALIATTGRAQAQGSQVHGPLDDPEGNVSIVWTRLADLRQRDLPGLGSPLPDWVAPGVTLTYAGSMEYVNAYDPAGFRVSYPVEMTVTVAEVGAGWATYAVRTATSLEGYLQESAGAGANGAAGGYWYDPAALAGMSAGTVLDDDPTTGVRLAVESADPAGGVTLRTQAPGIAVTGTYDPATGVLTRMTTEQSVTFSTLVLDLVSVE
jgi:hypothetical protein